ncbi:aminoglycoside phosphotransferase family protein [Microbacterium pumilum]|uniref:Aminoglycoside phosphotransferase domain-containing protein n=1 Tax=Microbacterium pumilum TaxID=344165 RepID=A0ABP5E7K9_9MICO
MPDKPAAEVMIDESLVRHLLLSQAAAIADAAELSVTKVAEGWDSEVWRVGAELAVRLPRRAIAAPLVLNEQRVLPEIARRLEPTGLRVPAPILDGVPDSLYPWPWSIVPWIDGARGIDVPRQDRSGWASALGLALGALHVPAPSDHPINPFRGAPLAERSAAVAERIALLREKGALSVREADAAASVWAEGLDAASWAGPPLWIHGDLHPANLIAQGTRLVGIIDFGDVTAGDPAYDLAVAWLSFDVSGRRDFKASTGGGYDGDAWVRARAWGASVALMLLAHSDDEPAFARLGREALDEVTAASR